MKLTVDIPEELATTIESLLFTDETGHPTIEELVVKLLEVATDVCTTYAHKVDGDLVEFVLDPFLERDQMRVVSDDGTDRIVKLDVSDNQFIVRDPKEGKSYVMLVDESDGGTILVDEKAYDE